MGFVSLVHCVPCISLMRFAGIRPITEWVTPSRQWRFEQEKYRAKGACSAKNTTAPLHLAYSPKCQLETVAQNLAKAVSRTVRGCPGVMLLLPSADAQ